MLSQNNGGGSPSGCESGDEEDPEDSSSSQQSLEDVLASFREKWQKELHVTTKPVNHSEKSDQQDEAAEDYEIKAKTLFMKGIEMEKAGNLYEAIQFYRRAVQLVPDIEFRIDYIYKNKQCDIQGDEDDLEGVVDKPELNVSTDDEDDEEMNEGNFLHHIEKKVNKLQILCLPAVEPTQAHIAALPMEIILYIFKWVVSGDLDLRSLEICSGVCRGFYLCARDPEIWKLACTRMWGLNCGKLGYYKSWREMFIDRPRLHFHGCYISKTTYIRHGENSFQDQYYRPWHLVAYYRYLRFFPEGFVLMLTTPDEPIQCVGMLKNRNSKTTSVLSGHYRLKDDKLTIVVQRQENAKSNQYNKRNRKRDTIYDVNSEQTFHLELQIQHSQKKRHVQLAWTGYSILTTFANGKETKTTFDIVGNRFPPLWFSRVKSYTSESFNPLQ